SGAMSGLNRASAGCFTRMTVSGRRLLRTYSVSAQWRRWGVL
ncbi:transposase, partial [Escherichia coli]